MALGKFILGHYKILLLGKLLNCYVKLLDTVTQLISIVCIWAAGMWSSGGKLHNPCPGRRGFRATQSYLAVMGFLPVSTNTDRGPLLVAFPGRLVTLLSITTRLLCRAVTVDNDCLSCLPISKGPLE